MKNHGWSVSIQTRRKTNLMIWYRGPNINSAICATCIINNKRRREELTRKHSVLQHPLSSEERQGDERKSTSVLPTPEEWIWTPERIHRKGFWRSWEGWSVSWCNLLRKASEIASWSRDYQIHRRDLSGGMTWWENSRYTSLIQIRTSTKSMSVYNFSGVTTSSLLSWKSFHSVWTVAISSEVVWIGLSIYSSSSKCENL